MKKTIITAALVLSLMVPASAATLQYGLDFDTMTPSSGVSITNQGEGTTAISNTGGYINWNTDTPLGTGYSHSPNGGTFNINGTNGINGLNFEDGFTLAFHVKTDTPWRDAISFKISNITYKLELTNTNTFALYHSDNDYTTALLHTAAVDTEQWNHIGFTFQNNTITGFLNGEEGESASLIRPDSLGENDSHVIYQIRGGSGDDHRPGANDILLDNLGVYSGVLTSDEFAALVPEPTTATLSLLALAGLAARRRRK